MCRARADAADKFAGMKVAVLFGGTSAERDVSVASGAQVVRALQQAGHEVLAVDTARGVLESADQKRLLATGVAPKPPKNEELALLRCGEVSLTKSSALREVDVVFLALHGGTGENGTIQAFFDLAEIPYTGAGVLGSATAMDKDISKRLLRVAQVPTPDWLMMPVEEAAVEERLGFPLVVKPNKQGSTIGLTVAKQRDDLASAIAFAYRYDDEVMLEKFICGREFTVGVLAGEALSVGEIIPQAAEIFDYQSKYQPGGAREVFPAEIDETSSRRLRQLAARTHQALKLQDYSRVDFRMSDDGAFWCLEANSLPGMTATSLLPQSAAAVGISFPELCDRICRLALERFRKARERAR
jgi:D-alanine-D-alanine ligase